VSRARNSRVWANAISATASVRQLAAAEAFARGDKGKADALIAENEAELTAAAAIAPDEAAAPLRRQLEDANVAKQKFRATAPGTESGKAAAKAAADTHVKNLSRPSF
jgi:Ca-activated chloride channel family protein